VLSECSTGNLLVSSAIFAANKAVKYRRHIPERRNIRESNSSSYHSHPAIVALTSVSARGLVGCFHGGIVRPWLVAAPLCGLFSPPCENLNAPCVATTSTKNGKMSDGDSCPLSQLQLAGSVITNAVTKVLA